MNPVTYFRKWGFSINEGGKPVNITVAWNRRLFFYMYFFGKQIVFGGKK